ncbi:MAG: hypothetical protein PHT59_00355 [Candidatus Omnitrophica bacterium]|nr:hypothetical protein [Candidatus Omnitrophota bacterium]
MKKFMKVFVLVPFIASCRVCAYAYSTEHHAVNMGRDLLNVVASPIKAVVYEGPRDIKQMYQYEVYGREKPEKRGLLRYKLFALWSAPAVELKAVINGLVQSVSFAGDFCKELLSIPFSD